jgi:D-aminopeptidase
VAERLRNGEAINLVADSSGMKFGRASEWHRQKYGRDASQTPWRKMHLSIDSQINVQQIAITEDNVSDEAGLNAMLAVDANVDCVIADGAYYSITQNEAWSACGVLPVIPPPAKRGRSRSAGHALAGPFRSVHQGTRASMRFATNTSMASARWSSRRSRASSAASARGY